MNKFRKKYIKDWRPCRHLVLPFLRLYHQTKCLCLYCRPSNWRKYSTHLYTFYMTVDIPPWGTLPLKFDTTRSENYITAFAAKRHSLKYNISITNRLIALKFNTRVKYLNLYLKRLPMTRLTPKLQSWQYFCIPQSFKCNISMNTPNLLNAISPWIIVW